jgi:hypothetical protein
MRLRLTFAKTGTLRYTGHLDLHRIWERTARRAGLPLAYSQGFHPQPKIQIAAALPLGFLGHEEIVDVWLSDDVRADLSVSPPADLSVSPQADTQIRLYQDMLQTSAPPGLTILRVEQVDDRGPALQTQVAAAEYLVTLLVAGPESGLERPVADLLAKDSLPRERRRKPYDLRPLILSLECASSDRLQMRLSAREGATGRPEEVLDELGIAFENTRIERTRLILKPAIE